MICVKYLLLYNPIAPILFWEWEIYFGNLHRYEILKRIMDLKNFLSVWVFTHSDEKKQSRQAINSEKIKDPLPMGLLFWEIYFPSSQIWSLWRGSDLVYHKHQKMQNIHSSQNKELFLMRNIKICHPELDSGSFFVFVLHLLCHPRAGGDLLIGQVTWIYSIDYKKVWKYYPR